MKRADRRGKRGAVQRRRVLKLLGLAMLAGTMGCGLGRKPKEEPPKVAPREEVPHTLGVDEPESFTFLADGVWYPAPFMILRDQRVRVELSERSAFIPDGVVRYRIGRMEQVLVSPPRDFVVTQPGAMLFYFDPARGGGYGGEVEIIVTRTR
jgi:hypothetical protein